MIGKTLQELKIGERAEFTKTISESDVYIYAGLTGDLNPAHVNEEYAKRTFFKTRLVHGMLLGGLISAVLGNKLPGPGTIYLSQHLDFLAPVRIGDTITASVEISEIMRAEKKVRVKTTCLNQGGERVLDGEAVVSPPRAPRS